MFRSLVSTANTVSHPYPITTTIQIKGFQNLPLPLVQGVVVFLQGYIAFPCQWQATQSQVIAVYLTRDLRIQCYHVSKRLRDWTGEAVVREVALAGKITSASSPGICPANKQKASEFVEAMEFEIETWILLGLGIRT
ncbi:hypothetical protein V6N12_015364 [Hibiscus sabdariffa]|uniref:Uncharacterized protein n=1 Tax=Hibiscus sabdariffa TaxID=183260 RepID=A0ABR2DNC8_9ROSI